MYLHLTDIPRIYREDNYTQIELERKTRRWSGYSLYSHHFWGGRRLLKLLEIEQRRTAPVVSDDEESASSPSVISLGSLSSPSVISLGSLSSNSIASRLSNRSISNNDVNPVNNEIEPPFILTARAWKLENGRVQRAWNKRSERVNKLVKNGLIEVIPPPIEKMDKVKLICDDIQHGWNLVTKKFRRGLKRYESKSSGHIISLGKERIQRRKAAYICLSAFPSLVKAVFGDNYCLLPRENIVKQTKKCIIIHIFSAESINSLLTLSGENPCELTKQAYTFQMSGKIEYDERGVSKTGYIVHETKSHLQVMRIDGSIFNIRKPTYDENRVQMLDNGERVCYDITQSMNIVEDRNGGIKMSWIHPIRIIITRNAEQNFRLLGNYFVKNASGVVDELLSS